MDNNKSCCAPVKNNSKKAIWSGIFFGLIPHSFCIAFILFSIIGATVATAFLKNILMIPFLLPLLLFISILLATISSIIYLKKTNCLCASGMKKKWKYITTMYSLTILVNLAMFFFVLPALANINSGKISSLDANTSTCSINVDIPCSGHAPLIIDELKKDSGIDLVKFDTPNIFEIKYNTEETSPEKITSLEIFKTYKATIN